MSRIQSDSALFFQNNSTRVGGYAWADRSCNRKAIYRAGGGASAPRPFPAGILHRITHINLNGGSIGYLSMSAMVGRAVQCCESRRLTARDIRTKQGHEKRQTVIFDGLSFLVLLRELESRTP